MAEANIGKIKLSGPNYMKKHQPKKEYSLRSKQNIKTLIVSEISHSGERVLQTISKERLKQKFLCVC